MITPTVKCNLCRNKAVTQLMDLGTQPICNRFLAAPSDDEFLHPMVIGLCQDCGLVQIINPVPAKELMPQVDWITYNEPEGHLDRVAQIIRDLPGITSDAAICGITFKDDSILARLEGLGIKNTWRIQSERDLGVDQPGVGVETIQERLTPETASKIAQTHGLADVVIVRHILEHAHDTLSFTSAVKSLVKPGGYVVFEVPDCSKSMENFDYSCPWEEHVLYFTPDTFQSSFSWFGLSLTRFESYPYALEDCLMGIAQTQEAAEPFTLGSELLRKETDRATSYGSELSKKAPKTQHFLEEFRRNNGKVAMFGAGHLACMYVGLLGIKEYLEFVVDDHPKKRGLFMPGSRLAIKGSQALIDEDIKLCLLSLSPTSQEKVVQNNQQYTGQGGVFASIFPASDMALQI